MENDPLLPYATPNKRTAPPPLLFPLPEHNEVFLPHYPSTPSEPPLFPFSAKDDPPLPIPLTPSEFKDRLIFGPSPSSSPIEPPPLFNLSFISPKPSSSQENVLNLQENLLQQNQINSSATASWLMDPNFTWDKTNLHRSKTAPAMAVLDDVFHPPIPKPQFGSQSIVRQAFVLLVLYLTLGVVIFWFNRHNFVGHETHPVVDALYFCIVTMCTIGYGDIIPDSIATKLFSILFVLVGFGFIDILLSGMVSYVLDLQENHLLRTVQHEAGKKDSARSYIIDFKKGRMRIRMKVGLALGVVVLCIGIGVGVMHFVERLGWLDSFYLSVMSVTTVGYGDRAFKTLPGRTFASIWLLVSTLAVARAFLYLAEARVDKRHRRMAEWVLGQDMTVSEFLAADIDNNGFVR